MKTWSILPAILAIAATAAGADRPLQPSNEEMHQSEVDYVAFSSDGKMIASVDVNRNIGVWDAETCKLQRMISVKSEDGDGRLNGVAFSPDGRQLVSVLRRDRRSRHLLVWNVETGEQVKVINSPWLAGTRMSSLEFAPDGQEVWSIDGKGVYRWDLRKDAASLHEVDGILGQTCVRFTQDNQPLAVSGMGFLRVIDVLRNRPLAVVRGEQVEWGDLLSNADRAVLQTRRGELVVWDIKAGQAAKRFRVKDGAPNVCCVLNTSNALAVFTTTGAVEHWNLETGEYQGRLARPIAARGFSIRAAAVEYGRGSGAWPYKVNRLVSSPDDKRLVLISATQFVVLPTEWEAPE